MISFATICYCYYLLPAIIQLTLIWFVWSWAVTKFQTNEKEWSPSCLISNQLTMTSNLVSPNLFDQISLASNVASIYESPWILSTCYSWTTEHVASITILLIIVSQRKETNIYEEMLLSFKRLKVSLKFKPFLFLSCEISTHMQHFHSL